MSDLVAGRYPLFEEEWVLDGQPNPPYRRIAGLKRSDITATLALTQATLFVFPAVLMPGDVINFVSFGVKTATATPTHSWVAVYGGVAATSALLTQSADVTTGFPAGNVKLQLGAAVTNTAQPGTPQGPAGGPGAWATTAAGPIVVGVAFYNSGATGAVLDGMAGGAVNGEVIVTGQTPISSSVALAATAAAPATLAGLAAVAGAVPYGLLSRS